MGRRDQGFEGGAGSRCLVQQEAEQLAKGQLVVVHLYSTDGDNSGDDDDDDDLHEELYQARVVEVNTSVWRGCGCELLAGYSRLRQLPRLDGAAGGGVEVDDARHRDARCRRACRLPLHERNTKRIKLLKLEKENKFLDRVTAVKKVLVTTLRICLISHLLSAQPPQAEFSPAREAKPWCCGCCTHC